MEPLPSASTLPSATTGSQFSGGTVDSIESLVRSSDILALADLYPCLYQFDAVAPSPEQRAHAPPAGKVTVYKHWFETSNFRLPPSPFLISLLEHYCIGFSQMHPLGLQKIVMFETYCRSHRKEPSLLFFSSQFTIASSPESWFTVAKRTGKNTNFCGKRVDGLRHWKDHFFFVDDKVLPTGREALLLWSDPKAWVARQGVKLNAAPEVNTVPDVDMGFFRLLAQAKVVMRPYPDSFLAMANMSRNWSKKDRVLVCRYKNKGRGGSMVNCSLQVASLFI